MTANPVQQGIYILANDHPRVLSDSIALLNSLKKHAPQYPVLMIPYDDRYHHTLSVLNKRFGVELYDNQAVFRDLDRHTNAIIGKRSPMVRKFACWFGPFDEFMYIDTDIVVLRDQRDVFDLLADYDIVFCGSGRYLGISQVFSEKVLERQMFSAEEIEDIFNAGFFLSAKRALSYDRLMSLFDEAATVSDIFLPNFEDQPLLNYVALKHFRRRANIRELAPEPGREPRRRSDRRVACDGWAGNPAIQRKGGKIVFSDGSPVRHIHWAGFKSTLFKPHLDVWLEYRYSNRWQQALVQTFVKLRLAQWLRVANSFARHATGRAG